MTPTGNPKLSSNVRYFFVDKVVPSFYLASRYLWLGLRRSYLRPYAVVGRVTLISRKPYGLAHVTSQVYFVHSCASFRRNELLPACFTSKSTLCRPTTWCSSSAGNTRLYGIGFFLRDEGHWLTPTVRPFKREKYSQEPQIRKMSVMAGVSL